MMNHGHFLCMAAWMREAQEATKLVENIDSRIKNKDLAEELMLRDIAQSKLREAGVKLDCLIALDHFFIILLQSLTCMFHLFHILPL